MEISVENVQIKVNPVLPVFLIGCNLLLADPAQPGLEPENRGSTGWPSPTPPPQSLCDGKRAPLPVPENACDPEVPPESQSTKSKTSPAAAEKPKFLPTDVALSEQFVRVHGKSLRWLTGIGQWIAWRAGSWHRDESSYVTYLISQFLHTSKLLRRQASYGKINAIDQIARVNPKIAIKSDLLDSSPWVLGTPKGIINLRTGEIFPAKPEDFVTKTVAVSPDKENNSPLWHKFLAQITDNNEELQFYFQRLCGYYLTGVTSEQTIDFLYGSGANGKSIFTGVIEGILGDYAVTSPMDTFMATQNPQHPTELARLKGARLVTSVETAGGRRWNESLLKRITGGERIAARYMRGNFFEFLPQCKLLFAGNHKPGFSRIDKSIQRRFHLVPFPVTIPDDQQDHELNLKLQKEWPGILAWMIQGCLDWQKLRLRPPQTVTDATEDYMDDEDNVGQWLRECTKKEGKTKFRYLLASFHNWQDENGERDRHISSRSLSQALESIGRKRCKIGAECERGFMPISLLDSNDEEDDSSGEKFVDINKIN